LACALVLTGCGGGGSNDITERPLVRLFNASIDASDLVARFDDRQFAGPVDVVSSQPNFVSVEDLDADLSIRTEGEEEDLDIISFAPERDKSYLIFAIGLRDFGTSFLKRLRVETLEVDRSLPNASKARVVVLNGFLGNAEFDPPNVDLRDGEFPQFPFNDLAFGATSVREVDAGTRTYQLRPNDSELVYTTAEIDFRAGKIYFILLTGEDGGTADRAPKITPFEFEAIDEL
jgi:hypothetical protein